jgi:hypothetical protein
MPDEQNPSTPNTMTTDEEIELRTLSSTANSSPSLMLSESQLTSLDDSNVNASVSSETGARSSYSNPTRIRGTTRGTTTADIIAANRTDDNGSSSRITTTTTTTNPTTGATTGATIITITAAPSATATATATTTVTHPSQRRQHSRCTLCFCRIFHQLLIIITYPCMVILTAFALVLIIIFCVLPTIICMAIGICIYYCLHEEPIPLPVLLRYIFSGEHADGHGLHGRATSNNDPNSRSQVDRKVFESKLIIRRLLKVEITPSSFSLPAKNGNENDDGNRIQLSTGMELENTGGDNDNDVGRSSNNTGGFIDSIYLREHPFPIQIFTENKSLNFSEPLVMKVEEKDDDKSTEKNDRLAKKERQIENENDDNDDDNDDDSIVINVRDIPHYQRSAENQCSNRNLREATIVPDNHSDLEPSQNETNLQDVVISLDDSIESTQDILPEENHVCQGCNKDNKTNSDDDDDHNEHRNDADEIIEEVDYNCFDIEGDMRDRGTTCDICILEFEVGDEVAWSPNLHCSHSFHKDCILDWYV